MLSSAFNINKPTFIYRDDNRVISSSEIINKKIDLLFKINTNNDNKGMYYEIIANSYKLDENNDLSPNSPWFILKPPKINIKMNRYKLNPGDIIKIGRITLRIRDIKMSSNNEKTSDLNDSNAKNMYSLKTEGEPESASNLQKNKNKTHKNEKNLKMQTKISPISLLENAKKRENNILAKIQNKNNVCRICYIEEEDNENPLLQPCICSGSMKFIHLSCLKHWIFTRSCVKIDSNEKCSVYIIKPVECELCKTKFPDYISHEGKLYGLLDFSKEYENYLTIESLTLDKHKNKFIYVVSLVKNGKMKIGRGHSSDVLLSDISVSRVHCHFVVENKKVYLEDNQSKFGSLVLIQYPNIKIMEGIPLHFQVGRTYIECRIKKNFKLFNCCNIEESSNILYYYNQNENYIQKHMNLIVKRDLNEEEDESEKNLKINNTVEQKYELNINEKYNYNSPIYQDRDKISDNEYFLMKYHKLNKNITKAMIDEDDNNDNEKNNALKIITDDKDIPIDKESNKKEMQNKEENEDENSENNNNKTENNNEINNELNNENKDTSNNNNDNNNQEEDKNSSSSNNQDNQDNTESICLVDNNETEN